MNRFPTLLIYFILATVPILFGAVQAWVWSIYTLMIYAVFLFLAWQKNRNFLRTGKTFLLTGGIFFGFTLLQTLPLPSPVSSVLFSPFPFKTGVLVQTSDLLGTALPFQSISYSPSASLAWWAFLFGLFLFFLAFRETFHSGKDLRALIWVLLGVALLESSYGLLQALVPRLGVLWVSPFAYAGDARGTYINRNHFAGFIEMMWPLALGFTLALGHQRKTKAKFKDLLASEKTNKQFVLVLIIVVMLLALLFSKSRAGITGAILGFLTFTWLARSKDEETPLGFWVSILVIVALLFLYGFKMGFDPIVDRFLRVESDTVRLEFWRDSLAILKDHPLGIGLGNFKHVFPVYFASGVSDLSVSHLHNDYLQILIEAGWPAFIALMNGFIFFMGKSIRKVKRMSPRYDPLRFYLAVGALSGIISMAFHSFFDFNLQIPANCVYFVTLMSMVVVCTRDSPKETKGRRVKSKDQKH